MGEYHSAAANSYPKSNPDTDAIAVDCAIYFSGCFAVADFRIPDANSECHPKSFSGRTDFARTDFALTEPV